MAELLAWVYYHDVIARFSILHWRHGPVETAYEKQLGGTEWESTSSASRPEVPQGDHSNPSFLDYISTELQQNC